MKVGNFQQKAHWFLVGFVFGCIFIITILLSSMQQAVAKGEDYYDSNAVYLGYLN